MPDNPHAVATVRRTTWVGLTINMALFAAKLAAGLVANSQALVADAIHSLSDGVTDVAVLVGAGFWSRPPDPRHPYGHRRIETIVTILVGGMLAAAGVGIAYDALVTLHQHIGPAAPPGRAALAVALASVLIKEALFRWTYAVGRRVKSPALKANAWHHRSDAMSSIPAACAIGAATLFPGWSLVDHVGAIVVSIFILQAAWKISRPALQELIDAGAPEVVCRELYAIARSVDGVRDAHALRTRYIGARLQIDLHVLVDGNITVRQGHDIAEAVSRRIVARGPDVIDVVVHIEPA
jgi:cation diffusion facilitator family transporter